MTRALRRKVNPHASTRAKLHALLTPACSVCRSGVGLHPIKVTEGDTRRAAFACSRCMQNLRIEAQIEAQIEAHRQRALDEAHK